jgi:hypothetical protein
MLKKTLVAAIAFFGLSSLTNAAVLQSEVTSNAYITKGGYDIAWAAPCAAVSPSCGAIDLSYQSQFGWELMTLDVWNAIGGILATDFVFDGANVDYATGNNLDEASGATVHGGNSNLTGDIAVASPWFSSSYKHIDWSNGDAGLWSGLDFNLTNASWAEGLVMRKVSAVPVPAAVWLLGSGLIGLIGFSNRKKSA